MQYTNGTDKIIPALFKARVDMSSKAKRNTANQHLKNRYANLESFLAAIRPALEANELMIMQAWEVGDHIDTIYLNTTIMHASGQSIHAVSPFPIVKKDAHGVGSAITYARRYAIAAMFGIAQADDDGNATIKTPTDVVKALKAADNAEALKEIFMSGRSYFQNDNAGLRVITTAYNERKADLIKPGEGFNPSQPPARPAEPEPMQAVQPIKPGEFSDF